ncbi:MAG: cobalamin-binding protein [Candidatus Melainabacteria bacterium]|nr:cobalamin-binding protein [Candidatus Melainabacteria bacterium]MBI3309529.1 cobalamin-binding protein [Candidatus Melainabacteria bacterium]
MKEPKIVSCSPAHSEILCLLGKENLIVGKTTYCDFPKDLLKEKPVIGSWIKINHESIEKLKPDLIITNNVVQEKIARSLKEAGFNVYHSDPLTLNQIYEDIIEIGKIANAKQEAETLVQEIKDKLNKIYKTSKTKSHKPKVYIEEWHDPPTISGNWIPEMVQIAGGDYGLLETGKRSIPVSIDKLFEYNPEKIIISWCGFGEKVDSIQVLNRSGWDSIKAIKEKDILVIDDSLLNRPGPRIVEGARKLQDFFIYD